jgi:hypothetical protein
MTRQAGPEAAAALASTGLSTRGRIEHVAEASGWTIKRLKRGMELERGKQWLQVIFDRRGAVLAARVGKLGGYDFTGPGKARQVITILQDKPATEWPVPLLKIISAQVHTDAFTIPACCDDPSPEVQPRHLSGQHAGHVIYCANCDTDWLTVGWTQADLDEYFADRHEVTS